VVVLAILHAVSQLLLLHCVVLLLWAQLSHCSVVVGAALATVLVVTLSHSYGHIITIHHHHHALWLQLVVVPW